MSHPRWQIGIGVALGTAAAVGAAGVVARRAHSTPDSAPALSEEALAGKALFDARCAACHSTTTEGTLGPGLGGVLGRKAGGGPGYGYSTALRRSGKTWDIPTLDLFLADPSGLVPGTKMPLALADANERRAVVAYLATLDGRAQARVHGGGSAEGAYTADAPGRVHRVDVASLPKPYATMSVRNSPALVEPPEDATPQVPPGFVVTTFTTAMNNPRIVRVAPNGDIFVAETGANRVSVLRAPDGAPKAETTSAFATEGLSKPFGIAFYPPGPKPKYVYVANTNSIVRFPYVEGDLVARGPAETVVAHLSETQGGHTTRDIAFPGDGARMLVSIGSDSNVAEGMATDAAARARAEETWGLGASWGDEAKRATVLSFDPDGQNPHSFANGIRNCVGLATRGDEVWCTTNERDGLGDDLVPDYAARVREGAFYGWPWYYLGDHEDPRHKDERRDLRGRITVPDVLLQAHAAALGSVFYEGTAFPPEYRGDLFIACHGSWNRANRTSPKVIRVRFEDGHPTGDYVDFVTGFVADEDHVWGRPVGVAMARDGSLIVTEDANDTVFRVSVEDAR